MSLPVQGLSWKSLPTECSLGTICFVFARCVDPAPPHRPRQSSPESVHSSSVLFVEGLESWAYFRLELALCAWLMPLHFYKIKLHHKESFLSYKIPVRMMEPKHAL